MYIKRVLASKLKEAAKEFAVVAILGPRQSGKTTLAVKAFSKHKYVSLEDYDVREKAILDPRGFLSDYTNVHGLILDEIQHAPKLLSYIQTVVDKEKKRGFFILTGSQNFLLSQAISQSLAGRMSVITLLPLSIEELSNAKLLPDKIETVVFNGSYPALYAQEISVMRLYQSYTITYLERDVRLIKNISDLNLFKKFLSLCAGRIGQVINYSSLSNDCGIDEKTVKAWLSVLEASYIIFFLNPYYKNFGKRILKNSKLYFVDTGLACSLLRIKSSDELIDNAMRGPLIESFIISDLLKQQYNLELLPSLYFWRDYTGNEIDCLIDEGKKLVPVEIKSSKTVISSFFDGINEWKEISSSHQEAYVVYSGNESHTLPSGKALDWKSSGNLIEKIIK